MTSRSIQRQRQAIFTAYQAGEISQSMARLLLEELKVVPTDEVNKRARRLIINRYRDLEISFNEACKLIEPLMVTMPNYGKTKLSEVGVRANIDPSYYIYTRVRGRMVKGYWPKSAPIPYFK